MKDRKDRISDGIRHLSAIKANDFLPLSKFNPLDTTHYGYDVGGPNGDYTVVTVFKRPGTMRKFLRWAKLDLSKWEYKLVSQKTAVSDIAWPRTGRRKR